MPSAYEWDVQGAPLDPKMAKTFTLSVFQWVPTKDGKKLKKSRAIKRFAGLCEDPQPTFTAARAYAEERNKGLFWFQAELIEGKATFKQQWTLGLGPSRSTPTPGLSCEEIAESWALAIRELDPEMPPFAIYLLSTADVKKPPRTLDELKANRRTQVFTFGGEG